VLQEYLGRVIVRLWTYGMVCAEPPKVESEEDGVVRKTES